MRRQKFWHTALFLLLAVFAATVQPQAKSRVNLQHPRNFAEAMARSQALMRLGQDLFSEKALSGSRRMSCTSCHDPDHAFTPANDLAVQLGGEKLDLPGNQIGRAHV